MSEAAAFLAFKSRPHADSLVDLLRAYEDRIFRLCYQVLHNAHDAEDAAQEVLLKIPADIGRFADPEAFRRWLNRVVLNAALESGRKAGRRRTHETRAAMERTAPAPIDAADRLALFEAIAALDEGKRNLVLDHYFEGESLESLAAREGCSAPAVCKRLDNARESMRRILGGATAVAFLTQLERLFPAAPATPDLMSGTVLAQVHTVAATLAAGGIAVGSKSTSYVIAVVVAILLGSGAVVAILVKSRPDRTSAGASQGSSGRNTTAHKPSEPGVRRPPSESTPGTATDVPAAPLSPLGVRLDRYKVWIKAWLEERKSFGGDAGVDPRVRDHALKKLRELPVELEGIRALITEDLATFLAFLNAPENELYLDDLLLFAFECTDSTGRVHWYDYESLSQALIEGLLDLLGRGTGAQKAAVLNFLAHAKKLPSERESTWSGYLADADSRVVAAALRLISRHSLQSDEVFQQVRQTGHSTSHRNVRWEVSLAMIDSRRPEAQEYLFRSLEMARKPEEVQDGAQFLVNKLDYRRRQSVPLDQPRLNAAIVAALDQRPGDPALRWLAWLALSCPHDQARAILERVREATQNDGLRTAVSTILGRMEAGDRRTHEFIDVIGKVQP